MVVIAHHGIGVLKRRLVADLSQQPLSTLSVRGIYEYVQVPHGTQVGLRIKHERQSTALENHALDAVGGVETDDLDESLGTDLVGAPVANRESAQLLLHRAVQDETAARQMLPQQGGDPVLFGTVHDLRPMLDGVRRLSQMPQMRGIRGKTGGQAQQFRGRLGSGHRR